MNKLLISLSAAALVAGAQGAFAQSAETDTTADSVLGQVLDNVNGAVGAATFGQENRFWA